MLARVTLTLPQRLLTQIDELARSRGLSRSTLVRHSLELMVQARDEEATSGLSRPSVVHAGHISTVDKARLGRSVGRLSAAKMQQVDVALQVSLGLRPISFGQVCEQHTNG